MMMARERRLRQVEEQRGEEQRREPDADRRECAGRRRLGAGARSSRTDRESAPVTGKAPGDGRADVGHAECDEFLVRVDALAALGGEREGNGDRLHVADDADQQRRARGPSSTARRRTAAAPASAGPPARRRGSPTPRASRPRPQTAAVQATITIAGRHLRDDVGGAVAEPDADHQRLQAAASPRAGSTTAAMPDDGGDRD